jgi:hypothetical protein
VGRDQLSPAIIPSPYRHMGTSIPRRQPLSAERRRPIIELGKASSIEKLSSIELFMEEIGGLFGQYSTRM